MKISKVISSNIDKLMKARPDLNTQEKLASKAGVSSSTIFRVRRGEVAITVDNLDSIAKAFGLEAKDLLSEKLLTAGGLISQTDKSLSAKQQTCSPRTLKIIDRLLELDSQSNSPLEALVIFESVLDLVSTNYISDEHIQLDE